MTATLSPSAKQQFFDANGNPLVGGKLYSYIAGTTSPVVTYVDSAGTTTNTNPIILDSRGEANVWLGTGSFKFKLTSAADVEIWTVDNISGGDVNVLQALSASTGSSLIGFVQSGTGAVATTVQTKLRESVSVKDFGAVGDGVTDDTAAIQAAITAAWRIYLPAGIYKISSALTIANNGTILFGDGMESTTINNVNVAGGHAISAIGTGPDAPLSKQHITIQDMSIVGATGGGDGIHFEYCMDSTVERVRISDCGGYGIFTDNSFSNSFRYLRLTDNEDHNMRLAAASNQIVVQGCRFLNAGTANNKSGLMLSDGYAVTIIGCSFESNNIGLELDAGQNVNVTGCYFEANRAHAIRIGAVSKMYGVAIQNCYMDGLVAGVPTAAYSVLISNSSENITIQDCTMSEVTTQHIVGNSAGFWSYGNRFVGSGTTMTAPIPYGTLTTELGISFGGGTTGITYGTRTGRYIKIGKLVTLTFVISLTAKGSSTGAARITGLPFTATGAAATGTGQMNQYYNMTGLTSAPMIYVENGLTTATLFEFGSANAASITDTRFTNTSSLWGTITYEASE